MGSDPIQSEGSRVTPGWALTETVSGSARNGSTPGCVPEDGEKSFISRLLKRVPSAVASRSCGQLRVGPPLVSPSADLDRKKAPGAERGDDQAAARVGGIRLGMAPGTERHQAVEIEVRAPLGALDDDGTRPSEIALPLDGPGKLTRLSG